MNAEEWKNLGKYIKIDNSNLFVFDTDPLATKSETIVIISGHPLISYDYNQIIPLLTDFYRVIIHDHFGFGFSDKPKNYNYSIIEHANDCIKLWSKLRLKEITIVASQYGGMIAEEILHKKNFNLIPFDIKNIIIDKNNSEKLHTSLNTINFLAEHRDISKYIEVIVNHDDKHVFNGENDSANDIKYKDHEKIRSIWDNFHTLEKQREVLVMSSYNEEIFLYWHRWNNALKESKIPITFLWRKDDYTNIQDVLLLTSTYQKENIKIVENRNCYTIENEPKSWLLMVLEQLDKSVSQKLRQQTFVC